MSDSVHTSSLDKCEDSMSESARWMGNIWDGMIVGYAFKSSSICLTV